MTYNIHALSVAAVALGVILIYGAALIVVSADVDVWKEDRRAEAERLTYWLCLAIAVFVFAVSGAA